jgi:GNAT superfamily N-acetyltransferase
MIRKAPIITSSPAKDPREADVRNSTEQLTANCEGEVLSFLQERPVHTVIMSGLISDNGLESSLSRGKFYAYRGTDGILEGVALIGHATLVEARSDTALASLAERASTISGVRLVLGEQDKVERFWNCYARHVNVAHLRRKELLFELRWPSPDARVVPGLRCARTGDLDLVVMAHARMAQEELGFNPLAVDPDGFRERCARRIKQKRVWVLIQNRKLIFKADVVAKTDVAQYLEGIYVDPSERGKGYGTRCLIEVSRKLLARTQVLCQLINEQNRVAQGLARKAGYTVTSCYESIFFREPNVASPRGHTPSVLHLLPAA